MDRGLNDLLKWGIENSAASQPADPSAPPSNPSREPSHLTPELMAALLGGPSDAELMTAAIESITSTDPEITLETKLTAFDNLEQLIESLDNANLLAKLNLWDPLIGLLGAEEDQLRLMAAWCVGTAVQNNEPCQERLVAHGGVERLVSMALGVRVPMTKSATFPEEKAEKDEAGSGTAQGSGVETKEVRRKAIYALSSAVRNHQPAMDVCIAELGKKGEEALAKKIDASDMDAVDGVINELRERALKA